MIEKLNIRIPFFGCPIIIHWSLLIFLVISAFISFHYFSLMIIIFLCATLHEIGHLIGGKIAKITCDKIVLHILGGGAYMKISPDARPSIMFPMVIGGPLASLILSLIFGALIYFNNNYINFLFLVNAFILLFNLLPIFPLDGGRLLKIFFMNRGMNFLKATYLTTRIGQGLAFIILGWSILSFDILLFITMILLLVFSGIEFAQTKRHYAYLIFKEITDEREPCQLTKKDMATIEKITYKKEKDELIHALREKGFELAK